MSNTFLLVLSYPAASIDDRGAHAQEKEGTKDGEGNSETSHSLRRKKKKVCIWEEDPEYGDCYRLVQHRIHYPLWLWMFLLLQVWCLVH